jgi:hypothetical protein
MRIRDGYKDARRINRVTKESSMTPQTWVLDFLMVYIFVKALVLAPLAWMTLVYRWSERQEQLRIDSSTESDATETALAA